MKTRSQGGNIEITNLGSIPMKGQARTWGIPTTCTIFFRQGKWYASITVQCFPARDSGNGSIGIDLGCKEAIALSSGEKIAKPDFIKQGHQKVKLASASAGRSSS
ncbi:MAG: hypothetical protein JO235_07445 [Chroococcidiopsidaceae cyanobacterium CP_BM_RX_35]|nr:hypothetical protein [Chroococcidiopsidaceae cyanobacterium CP_BM_RX_35]